MAVKSVKDAVKDYQERFGFRVLRSGDAPQLGIRNAILQFGDAVIEFIEPLNPGEGPVAKFLETRGEGVYMMGWEVENLEKAIVELQAKGIRLINADPAARARGTPVFIHPKDAHGLMVELVEKAN